MLSSNTINTRGVDGGDMSRRYILYNFGWEKGGERDAKSEAISIEPRKKKTTFPRVTWQKKNKAIFH